MDTLILGVKAWGRRPKDIPAPTASRIEAETFTIIQNFNVSSSGQPSGGQWLQGAGAGLLSIARYTHGLGNGTFSMELCHFDESDGQSSFAVYINDVLLDSWVWNVDADQGTGNASAASRVIRTLPSAALVNGDIIEIRGTPHASEAMRVDYIDFTPI